MVGCGSASNRPGTVALLLSLGWMRQTNVELSPSGIGALQRNLAAMRTGQFPRGTKAEAASGYALIPPPAIETFEEVRDTVVRNPRAGVADT